MTPGEPLNWIIAVAMLGTAILAGLARRISLLGGEVIDTKTQPRTFWLFVGGCGVVGLVLLVQAIFAFR